MQARDAPATFCCNVVSSALLSCRYWDIEHASDFLGAKPGAMKALTGPCRCCERPTTRYARDMVVPGTSGMCPDCWQLESERPEDLEGSTSFYIHHYTDSNVIWDTRQDLIAKIIAVGGYTISPDKLLFALGKQIRATCPISGCMDFQNLLASFLTNGLRIATEQIQTFLDAVGSDACSRVYALIYTSMLCPWECHGASCMSFLVVCNVPWCTIQAQLSNAEGALPKRQSHIS